MGFLDIIKKIFGTKNERELRKLRPIVARINELEPQMKELKDEEFPQKMGEYKQRYENGESLDSLLPEVFALVREASVRTTGMRHFDVQLIGGIVLHQGKIAEMKTGEGKTLVATLPLSLNALTGRGVHLVTVNDYLAKRDAEWMGKIYKFLGLSVGVITHDLSKYQRKENYACDIVYGTNNEFGFDYLRDNMEYSLEDMVQRDLYYAIVDEVDSILIDEARTPLIISGPKEESTELYYRVDAIIPKLQKGRHYTIDEKSKSVYLTDEGVERVEQLLGVKNLFDPKNILLLHHVNQALRAHAVFKRDVDYLVQNGKVLIIDEFTGRALPGRRWSDGLHQAIEAKEKVKIEAESETLATISFQNYFRLYEKLAGMTGTAATEANEFYNTYKLEVIVVPTHKPVIRKDYDDVVYRTEREKFEAVIREIKECHQRGQPTLVGTISIEKSELLHKMLSKMKIPHNVLNAKHHAREAEIVAQAGRKGAVTIATNMAGRGTDIILGGNPEPYIAEILEEKGADPKSMEATIFIKEMLKGNEDKAREIGKKIAKLTEDDYKAIRKIRDNWLKEAEEVRQAGGLHIIGTERHEARRIDNQLRGRSGRQGDPGSSRFYLSLEDELMRRFGSEKLADFMQRLGMEYGEPIEHPFVTKAIESAQRKVEAYNYEIRKNLLEYDNVKDIQRKTIYSLRRRILESKSVREDILDIIEEVIELILEKGCPPKTPIEEWDLDLIEELVKSTFNLEIAIDDEKLFNSSEPLDYLFDLIWDRVYKEYQRREEIVTPPIMRRIESELYLYEIDKHWKAHLTAIEYLQEGIGLQGYRQIDPKIAFKKEAFQMFEELITTIKTNLVKDLFHVDISEAEEEEGLHLLESTKPKEMYYHHGELNDPMEEEELLPAKPVTVRRDRPKIGRNDPCWCGSGKKYKKCHYREDQEKQLSA